LNDIASEVGYFNLSHRWKWGIVGGQVPYVTGTFRRGLVTSEGGDPLLIDRQIIYRESQRSASAILSYPFDRTRRVEFRGGFARTSFEQLVSARIYSPISGNTVSETTETFDLAPHLNLMTSAAAVVRDATSFGPVSPVQGQRYRLEVSPTYGSINFTGVLVDYRRYVMPVSFYTIAARFVHYGRYGDGGDDSRLYPVYVNDPGFVRGYSTIYYATDCAVTSENACQLTSRFAGSRLLVGNVELRFPLLRPFGVTRRMYGPMPIELALFADTGTAWTGREKPALLGGSRPGISSAGVAIRMSMGFAVGEFDFVRPFQQPGEGWTFGFTLLPGW
jgi:outer membrane protein assembly factor BamA